MSTRTTTIVALAALTIGGLSACKVPPPATSGSAPADSDLRVVSTTYSRSPDVHAVICAPAGETLRSAETVWRYQVSAEEEYSISFGTACPTDQPLLETF